jgi:hypothetical protein
MKFNNYFPNYQIFTKLFFNNIRRVVDICAFRLDLNVFLLYGSKGEIYTSI